MSKESLLTRRKIPRGGEIVGKSHLIEVDEIQGDRIEVTPAQLDLQRRIAELALSGGLLVPSESTLDELGQLSRAAMGNDEFQRLAQEYEKATTDS